MGSKQRVEREKETVSAAILQAARELFVEEGYRNVSMRKLAERIEYSPAAIYSYFPAKDDIFFALAEEGFRLLAPGGRSHSSRSTPTPSKRVRRAVLGVLPLQPRATAVLRADVPRPHGARRSAAQWERFSFVFEMTRGMSAVVQRCIDTGVFAARNQPRRGVSHSLGCHPRARHHCALLPPLARRRC